MPTTALDPITAGLNIGSQLIDRLWPDQEKKDAAKLELLKLQQSGELAQIAGQLEINKEEAKSSSVFVAGARPFVMWVCGVGCAWNWIGLPVGLFISAALGHPLELRQADISEMMPLLFGMLGLGAYRTYEKTKGVAS
jgi:hypothetical protein